MKNTRVGLAVMLLPAFALAADSSLFSFRTQWPLGKGGQWGAMNLEEVDRTDSTSIVEISGTSPSIDTSGGFLLTAMCELAKAREQRYFQAREIDSDPLTFEVTFPKTAPNTQARPVSAIAPSVFPVSRC
jgi:hypothetical protein